MPAIIFSYPHITPSTLTVETGANEIAWSYSLNTVTYPTYAGEVVQVLSTKIENITIQGDVQSYEKMEHIYEWFLKYVTSATIGERHEDPVTMEYPHRNWKLKIQPLSLPGLMYGRDVVVPRWQMQAHVVEADPEQTELTIDANMDYETLRGNEMNRFRTMTADVGFRQANPFSDPLGVLTKDEAKLWPEAPNAVEGEASNEDNIDALMDVGKRLNQLLEQYLNTNFKTLMQGFDYEDVSKPADKTQNEEDAKDKPDQEKRAGKKKH